MKNDLKFDLKPLLLTGKKAVMMLKPYTVVLIVVLFAAAYSLVILRINSLSNAEVDQNAVTSQVKSSPSLRIDPQAVQQLQSLKDNSVNVQTLFENQRTNPFE
ncbi:MAG TPA: hypothetical protein VGO07_02895 [Candidatus Saccharimonadales bacterium]|jgi:hypothetical protein|nr:hypothetical protein [Candidatus Saccharimonadales bacterium]